jgi:hypothetical protein
MSNFNYDEALFTEACNKADCDYHSYAPAVGGKCVMKPVVVEPEHEMCK